MRFALVVVTASLVTGCYTRPSQADVAEVRVRQAHRYDGECHSWLRSSRTGFEYCASPAFKVTPADHEVVSTKVKRVTDGPVTQEALMKTGEQVYSEICIACHQADGKGQAGVYPPLAGAGEFYGTPQNMSGIIVKGLSGVAVMGQTYSAAMPPQGHLSDYEIAAVATYVRSSFGNNDGMVTPDDVKSAR